MIIRVGGEAWREEPAGGSGEEEQGVQATVGSSGDGPAVVVRDVDWGVGGGGCELDGTYAPSFDDACYADGARELLNCDIFRQMRGIFTRYRHLLGSGGRGVFSLRATGLYSQGQPATLWLLDQSGKSRRQMKQ